jgi:hypothetical protein
MQERFALRFESGERRGETIAVPQSGLTLGRRPGNSVQILDASVSGKHAEIVLDDRGALVRDLGSTNGTFVGPERVSERRLAHSDLVTLGKVRMLFIDGSLDRNPPPASDGIEIEGDVAPAGESMHTISADKLARSGKRSALLAGAVVALAAVGAGAWWYTTQRGGARTETRRRAVEPLAGNLIATGYSFEGDLAGWQSAEDASSRFVVDASAAASGESGLRAVLSAGDWAIERSDPVRANSGSGLRAAGKLSADEGVRVRLGIEFESTGGEIAPLRVWSAPVASGAGFKSAQVAAAVPPGYDKARALVAARADRASGAASADDVGLVASSDASSAVLRLGQFEWYSFGEPAQAGMLAKHDRPLIGDIALATGETDPLATGAARIDAKPREDGFTVEFTRQGESARAQKLSMRVEPAAVAQGVATLGDGGYRTHQVEFQREKVESVLVGAGLDLVRVHFASPVTLRGRPEGGAFRLDADLGDASGFDAQVAFQKDRVAADEAAKTAREAEKAGQFGRALAAWKDLLDRAPFEAALVKEAESRRAELIQKGLEEVQKAKASAERARFFRLVDLFRQCRRGAEALAEKYAGSEVETAARELASTIDEDLGGLEQDLSQLERTRLEAILAALEKSDSPKLAARVREALAAMPKPAAASAQAPAADGGAK